MATEEKKQPIWKVMTSPCGGRPRRFEKPQELWDKFIEYCRWIDENPWQVTQVSSSVNENDFGRRKNQNQGVSIKQRAYTLYGFCAYAGTYKWGDFKRSYLSKKGFSEVISAIEACILSQQVDGALLHQFDSNLVARINGMADRTELTGKDGTPIERQPINVIISDEIKPNLNGNAPRDSADN